jgi:hypothetical protein
MADPVPPGLALEKICVNVDAAGAGALVGAVLTSTASLGSTFVSITLESRQ